jgi:autotransporter-associated beta strand protein
VGTLNLNGGTFNAGHIEKGAGAGGINFNGGVLKASADDPNFIQDFASTDLNLQSGGLVLDSNSHAVAVQSVLSGIGGLTKQGAGTLTLSAANTYTGTTSITAGTLTLGASNRIADASATNLGGGTLNLANFSETLAALTLGSSSTIDFGSIPQGNSLTFANSNSISWSGTLTLANFEVGTDTLSFSSPAGLTLAQLNAISVPGYTATGLDGSGFVTFAAVPEPSSYALAVVILLGMVMAARRRATYIH